MGTVYKSKIQKETPKNKIEYKNRNKWNTTEN